MPQKEALFEIARRRFDTPEFRGIEFIETECKTIINHVPGGGFPFEWTINPYRGCTHACSYCLAPDTPILMGSGRTKRIADVRAGDEVYGTVRSGSYRRYVKTNVKDQWTTTKPAYRITLDDGTRLIASGDHRFLSNRGWKYVTGSEHGPEQRPFITTSNRLIGTGKFADAPKHDHDYILGYLCGTIRGAGAIDDARATDDRAPQFRVALKDRSALERTRLFLRELDARTDVVEFKTTQGSSLIPITAIRTGRASRAEAIREMVALPLQPSESWDKGFLAGVFDASGGYSDVLRISNLHAAIAERTTGALLRFGFAFAVEDARRANGSQTVRIRGGLREVLRFFHSVDPAIARKLDIEGRAVKASAPKVVSVEPLGFEMPMVDISTGTGDFVANGIVSHNCFARVTHTYLNMNAGSDFESQIVVKVNAPEVLRAQLRSRRWKGDHIAMGTGTDPYQRVEGRYKLMPQIIRALIDYRNSFSILTKGTLILRDLPLLLEAAQVAEVSTAFSVGTLDEEVWRRTEPGTPHPKERINAVRKLNEAGIPCGVLVAPILPGISDRPEQLRAVVTAAIDAGATSVSPIVLHLRPVVREHYMGWLAENYPDLVPRYESMYARSPYAGSSERHKVQNAVARIVAMAGGVKGGRASHRGPRRAQPRAPREPKQLKML